MGKHLNRGAGMGLEVPCMYKFAGQESSIESLRTATLLALITPALIGVNFGLLALLGPAQKGPRF